ncbi:DUF3310 domain-containing protein [Streptomyces microflavus]|uniref:DUF3310 domain-containing protein n=1 Tax=Streptomyces microflavus TaxID=1919 RepID=UPI0036C8548B
MSAHNHLGVWGPSCPACDCNSPSCAAGVVCTDHTGAERRIFGCNGPDPAASPSSFETAPAHYQNDTGMQPWDIWKAFDLDPWQANAIKYLLRAGRKDGESTTKDLKKARHYIDYLIEREETRHDQEA